MEELIATKLREQAMTLRKMVRSDVLSVRTAVVHAKTKFLQEIHAILTVLLGAPPPHTEKFTWQYYDGMGDFCSKSMTPLDFFASLGFREKIRMRKNPDVHDFFSLVNDPRYPYNRLLTVDWMGNVAGGQPVRYINVDMAVCLTPTSFTFSP